MLVGGSTTIHSYGTTSKRENEYDEVLNHIPELRAYSRSLTSHRDDADDLVQTTLTKAIASISRYEPGTNMGAWMFTIMRNTFLTEIRKQMRERPAAADCASTLPVTAPVHDAHIAGERLRRCIAKLPRHYREVLVLVVVIGESYKDAARVCGCSIGTVKSRVNRARALVIEDMGSAKFLDFH